MMVLSIDTCGPKGSVALGKMEGVASLLGQTALAGKTYSAQLAPAANELLETHGMDFAALDAIVVVNGPGSFTGVRIGVSTAKGFAEALGIPVWTVSRLAVLAWKAETEAAAIDAGRGELYFRTGLHETLLSVKNAPTTASVAVCEMGVLAVFPGALLSEPPTAGDALRFAATLLTSDAPDVASIDGNYLRRSDAEIFGKMAGKA